MMVEFAKLKRTKIVWLCLLMCAGNVLFSNMNLFAGDPIADFQADPHTQWASHLVGLGMALAFLTPLLLALVAHRQFWLLTGAFTGRSHQPAAAVADSPNPQSIRHSPSGLFLSSWICTSSSPFKLASFSFQQSQRVQRWQQRSRISGSPA